MMIDRFKKSSVSFSLSSTTSTSTPPKMATSMKKILNKKNLTKNKSKPISSINRLPMNNTFTTFISNSNIPITNPNDSSGFQLVSEKKKFYFDDTK